MTESELNTVATAVATSFLMFYIILVLVVYILRSYAHMKAFKMMGYHMAWAAWIPVFRSYALADCIPETKGKVRVLGFYIPGMAFKFWWLVSYIVIFIPTFGGFLYYAVQIICAGLCYTSIYATLEGKSETEVKVVGYLSSCVGIIPIVKFLTYKNYRK